MRFLTQWPLRTTLPVFLFVTALMLLVASMQRDIRTANRRLEEDGVADLIQEMTVLQGVLNNLLRKGDLEGVEAVLADMGAKPNMNHALLANKTNAILYANDTRIVGKTVTEALPGFDLQSFSASRKNVRGTVSLSASRDELSAYYPVMLSAQMEGINPSALGVFHVSLDLAGPKAVLKHELRQRLLQNAGYSAIVFFLLAYLLRLVVTKRAARLVSAVRQFSAGEGSVRADSTGKDELSSIASAFNQMVEQIAASQRILRESEEKYRQLYSQLTSEQALLRTLVDLLPTLIFVKDREGRFLAANVTCARYMGAASPQALIGKTDAEFYPSAVAAGFRADELRVLEGLPVVDREEGGDLPGSPRRILLTNKVPLRGSDGNIIGLVGTCLDITERKRAEAEKAKLEVQLQQAQKMESIGRLAGGVAHDFNNMLQAILGNVDLALGDLPPDSPARESLEEIRKSAQRSADLTRQLLAFARKQTIAPKVLDLNTTVEGMLKMLRRLIGEDIDLAWLPAAGLGAVKMDPSQIDQILTNLCVNARDAIGGMGKVTIETGNVIFDEAYCADHPGFMPGEYVLLAVSDNGRGMDKATLAQLFEPFFTTKDVGEGTGLGLATIYGIVKQNHGFIHVYSELGQGTTFKLYLPRYADQAAANRSETAGEPPASAGETVLLVEDEPAILAVARRVLTRLGYTVLTASTPGEAIRLAETHTGKIHLLMTDVVMPEMNGRQLATRLMSIHPELKCLFMSGYTANVIAHHGVLDEGVHFIPKPFSIQDLGVKVRAVLGDPRGA